MHPNPIFRKTPADRTLAFVRAQSFGAVTINSDPSPLMAHVPFVVSEDGKTLRLHFVRSNPIARALRDGPLPALIAVQGPHGYVSPDWYQIDNQVPTWNYVAAHLRGSLSLLPDDALTEVLDTLSEQFETRLLPKTPWTMAKMDPGIRDKMMRQIVPAELAVETVDSTWKLGQNKPGDAPALAADGLETAGIGMEAGQLAAWMRSPPG